MPEDNVFIVDGIKTQWDDNTMVVSELGFDHTATLDNHGKIPAKHIRLIQVALVRGFDEVVDDWKRLFGDDIHFDR